MSHVVIISRGSVTRILFAQLRVPHLHILRDGPAKAAARPVLVNRSDEPRALGRSESAAIVDKFNPVHGGIYVVKLVDGTWMVK